MKHIKHFATLLFVLAAMNTASAQFAHQRDYKPILTQDYTNIEGSAYLYDTWQPGDVTLVNGQSSKERMQLKYNVVNDEVSFKDKESGEEMVFTIPVQEFSLSLNDNNELFTRHFRAGYKNIEGTTPANFFEVLSKGKIQLIKRFSKVILETQPIGSASKTRNFIEKTKYYLVNNGKALPVKNDRKAFLGAFSDKQAQIDDYIKTNKVNFKSDAQLAQLVDYYNSL